MNMMMQMQNHNMMAMTMPNTPSQMPMVPPAQQAPQTEGYMDQEMKDQLGGQP